MPAWMNYAAQERNKPTQAQPEPFDYGTPWGYEFFLNAGPTSDLNKVFGGEFPVGGFLRRPNYDSTGSDGMSRRAGQHRTPVLNVAGWFDAEDFCGPVSIYQKIERKTSIRARLYQGLGSGAWHRERGSSWRHSVWQRDI